MSIVNEEKMFLHEHLDKSRIIKNLAITNRKPYSYLS